MTRGLATCPWCDWRATIVEDDEATAVRRARAAIDEHNREAGHKVKPGRQPRVGYRRGEPVQ